MPIDEFLARMLFFLPNKHEKSVRYYGIYVRPAKKIRHESLDKKSSWAEAIKSSFDVKDPLACPVCKNGMETRVIYSFQASSKEKELKKKYALIDGYFYQKRTRDPPALIKLSFSSDCNLRSKHCFHRKRSPGRAKRRHSSTDVRQAGDGNNCLLYSRL
jgi:hypothetical protein